MINKKLITILISLALITGIVYLGISWSRNHQPDKGQFLRVKKNTGPIFRGFRYSKYNEDKKILTIKAAHFSVEKKKVGVFRLSPFKYARFRGAEIDLFGETVQPNKGRSQPRIASIDKQSRHPKKNEISFKGVISRDTMPPSMLKGANSAICEPIKIKLYLADSLITKIQANKAIVDPRMHRMILRDSIQVTSGSSHLSTDRLTIYPESGVFEVDNYYVLKSLAGTSTGKNLTTDFYLDKISNW
jgi:hypothetical protein